MNHLWIWINTRPTLSQLRGLLTNYPSCYSFTLIDATSHSINAAFRVHSDRHADTSTKVVMGPLSKLWPKLITGKGMWPAPKLPTISFRHQLRSMPGPTPTCSPFNRANEPHVSVNVRTVKVTGKVEDNPLLTTLGCKSLLRVLLIILHFTTVWV